MSRQKTQVAILSSKADGYSDVYERLMAMSYQPILLEGLQDLYQAAVSRSIDALVLVVGSDIDFLRSAFHQKATVLLNCPVVVVIDEGNVDVAVESIRLGAFDVVTTKLSSNIFEDKLNDAVGLRQSSGFTCEAERSRQLLGLAERVAQTDVTVLINGESGTGKEVLAKHIHENSRRAEQSFVAVNCASIPESMLEDMLFGHEKGAFTGAHQRHEGLFEQAHRGTIFLDEIGEMPMILQAKILRVLQERELRRLGGNELVQLDVRVIAATNRDLAERVVEKEFREDLFYRLNVFPLQLSALRDRIEDILPIANALIKKHRKLMGRAYKLSKETQDFLRLYPWPGNVRELENVVQRAMVLAVDGVIEVEHLLLEDYSTVSTQVKDADQHLTAEREQAQQIMNEMAQPSVDQTPSDEGLSDLTWKSESKVILDTLSRFSGNRKNTAEKLGISPRTLRYKLAKLKEEGVAVP